MSDASNAPLHANLGKARDTAKCARRTYPYRRPPDLDGRVARYPVAIAGAGPSGLALAIELANFGIPSIVLERLNTLSAGSRAICWAKRSLEICDRLGVGERMREKGVTWNVGKVFVGDADTPLFTFDLLPDRAQKFPAFVNLQQFYAEEFLIDALDAHADSEIRWLNEVVGVTPGPDGVEVEVETPDGRYRLECEYLVAADGHRSPIRQMLGLDFEGRMFEDNFLIADVKMQADFPAERKFWFDPPFNPGQTALLHKQADDVWRIDFQMGWGVDRENALSEQNVEAKVRAFLGPEREFEYDWVSIYTFQCRRMSRFVHERVIFVGDAAHLVSPFGARGGNGALQDVDNLGWKLAYVRKGLAPADLIETYNLERVHGADENLRNSSRSTDFMTPKNDASRAFRDAVLDLARDYPFARAFVNSGRLSVPCVYEGSPLNTPDTDAFAARVAPGAVSIDAPITCAGRDGWLLEHLGGTFAGLWFTDDEAPAPPGFDARFADDVPVRLVTVTRGDDSNGRLGDPQGIAWRHYDAQPGTFYLVRPDPVVAARFRAFDIDRVRAALMRAIGRTP